MAAMRCARCQAPVDEQDLAAGRGAALGTMVMCQRCLTPSGESPAEPPPGSKGKDFEVLARADTGVEIAAHSANIPATRTAAPRKPNSSAMPAAVPFAAAAVPINQSAFFKDMDAQDLGSGDPATATAQVEGPGKEAPHQTGPSAPPDRVKLIFTAIGSGVGAFMAAIVLYLVLLAPRSDRTSRPKPAEKPAAHPAPVLPSIPAGPATGGETSIDLPREVKRSAGDAFDAIRRVPIKDKKERRRLLQAFLKEYEDPIYTARARVMLEGLEPVSVKMDFEENINGWEKWGDDLGRSEKSVHWGQQALCAGPKGEGGGIWLNGFVEGGTYYVSFWCRRDPDVTEAYVGTEFGTSDNKRMAKRDCMVEWQEYEKRVLQIQAPAGTTKLYFWVWRAKGSGNVYLDDVEITEASP